MTTALEFIDKVRIYQVKRDHWYAAIETYNHMKRNGASKDALAVQLNVITEAQSEAALLAFNLADVSVHMVSESHAGAAYGKVGAQ